LTERPALSCGHWDGPALLLAVRIQPRGRRLAVGPVIGQRLKLFLTAPPVDGKANEQARTFLAGLFGVSASRVTLVHGGSARDKLFRIEKPQKLPPEIVRESASP
jgi:hypothetical protein